MKKAALCALVLAAVPATAYADPIPERIVAMLQSAVADNDPAEIAATVKLAKQTNPASAAEIDALVAQLQANAAARQQDKLTHMSLLEGWTGQGEAGITNSTGNTRSTALALGLHFARTGLRWDHAFDATVDYQRTDGIESQSRYFAGYSGHYKFDGPLYGVGVLSWEGDRFSGFNSRLTESIGLGYQVLQLPDMQLAVEAGPALRQTDYIAGGSENSVAGRASVNYKWDILPSLSFTEVATYYGESRDSTVTSDTGLTAQLIGALSARLSYHVQYETNPPLALEKVDTITRLTLVYSFI